jgi:hypothetical protein
MRSFGTLADQLNQLLIDLVDFPAPICDIHCSWLRVVGGRWLTNPQGRSRST